ncbi:hypothetical protein GGTG_09564 [Gaeumannomyces tritici R3-111a-1]|uniref:Uncharacterized protein n=1 Tax=Gaeumannomyces tritici (strain R3-111a-1) TaxID=644352 RepID=J3P7S2_GAET3|nr:hypothetical protein GGTG_09564 [Gaeumannomyces tritici R3-111a-1]EJT72705.1 hypothetical protein GGTG_09564 [Gaeumannomyces tritici R3-111a-1]
MARLEEGLWAEPHLQRNQCGREAKMKDSVRFALLSSFPQKGRQQTNVQTLAPYEDATPLNFVSDKVHWNPTKSIRTTRNTFLQPFDPVAKAGVAPSAHEALAPCACAFAGSTACAVDGSHRKSTSME